MELTSAKACQNKLRENSSEADDKFEPRGYSIAPNADLECGAQHLLSVTKFRGR